MILSNFLSRQKYHNSNPHKMTPVSFNMHSVLQERHYKIGNSERNLVQTWYQAKFSGKKPPEVHGIRKSLNPNVQWEKQVTKPLVKKYK